MIENSKVEEIKKLIKNGFDLELLSFELDIPIEEIRQYKLELETSNKSNSVKTYSARDIIDSKNKQAHLKMEQMREKYKKLSLKSNKSEVKISKELQKKDIELINSVIAEIEKIVNEMKGLSKKEKRKKVNYILLELKKIKDYPLTIEQAEELNSSIQSEELEKLNLNMTDKIDSYINRIKKAITRKLLEAIDIAQIQTENLDELETLYKKLTTKLQQNSPIYVDSLKSKIKNKIYRIKQQEASDRIKNDVPTEIESIIADIANGTLDIKLANEIIDEEAKKRLENKPKNKFSLTEEQEKRQILIQINSILMEKPEQYHIKNPKITIMQIQELCGWELEQAIRTVVNNLTCIKDFKTAKEVCDSFSNGYNDSQFSKYMVTMKKGIKNAEIGDIVLRGLNMNGTEEDDRAYFDLIEKGIKMGNVKLGAVFLGKSQDGLRNIYLSDIWETEDKIR